MAKRKSKTKFQALVSSKASFCKGKTTKSAVRKHASAYVKHAVTKLGKSAKPTEKKKAKSEAKKIAHRVLNGGCKVSTVITGRKKKK